MISTRSLVALAALALAAGFLPAPAEAAPAPAAIQAVQPAPMQLTAADGRAINAIVWTAPDEKAVVVFSHGFGAVPAAYAGVFEDWAAHGFTVIAPIHVDSQGHAERQRYDSRQAFLTRIADLTAARDFVRTSRPGAPIAAAGHSFGSLMSAMEGGAVTVMGPVGDADVRAVVAFSSPGDIPGLVTPETWAGLTAPLLMITGDQDLVPGFVSDWRAHRSAFDQSPPGGKMLLVFAGADHNLVRDADATDAAFIRATTLDFLRAHVLGDAEAQGRLDALTPPEGAAVERR